VTGRRGRVAHAARAIRLVDQIDREVRRRRIEVGDRRELDEREVAEVLDAIDDASAELRGGRVVVLLDRVDEGGEVGAVVGDQLLAGDLVRAEQSRRANTGSLDGARGGAVGWQAARNVRSARRRTLAGTASRPRNSSVIGVDIGEAVG
jgi:hypothetical protein